MSPRCTLTLRLLREAGARGVTIGEFLNAGVGTRYGARLEELRKAGYEIETRRQGSGSVYTLISGVEGDDSPSEAPAALPLSVEPDTLFTAAVHSPDTAHWKAA